MKEFLKILAILGVSVASAQATLGQATEQRSFEKRMYSVSQLSFFGSDPQEFAGLSVDDQRNLLQCRRVLMALLQDVETGADARKYLTKDLARTYETPTAFASSLVESETSLVAAGVTEFSVEPDRSQVNLHFFVVTFSEGNMYASEMTATLRKSASDWRISRLK